MIISDTCFICKQPILHEYANAFSCRKVCTYIYCNAETIKYNKSSFDFHLKCYGLYIYHSSQDKTYIFKDEKDRNKLKNIFEIKDSDVEEYILAGGSYALSEHLYSVAEKLTKYKAFL